MKTWHIIGADGYIASCLLPRIPKNIRVVTYTQSGAENSKKLELTDLMDRDFDGIKPGDYVVFLAAISSPDVCRDRYDFAYSINVTGTKKFIAECVARQANVLFFSSDVVIGATMTAADENVQPHPFGNYGAMKREIEEIFAHEKRVKVFRLSYVFSRQDKFMSYLNGCAQRGETADVFSALYRSVVYLGDVLDAILALADSFEAWENHIFHICGTQLLCRSDLAAIFQEKICPQLKYVTSVPDAAFFEARPNVIEAKSLYLQKLLHREPTKISDAVQLEYLDKFD